jgi:two-component system LytT family response regulator
MSDTELKILVVDDEPLARRHVRGMLASQPNVRVVGEAGNGRDAVTAIRSLAPDLVLLDVQMPELDGFGVVEAIGADGMPDVIFVTAFDEYAVRAFEVHALDYVLKPVERERLLAAVGRARKRVATGDGRDALVNELRAIVASVRAPAQRDRITIKVDGRHIVIPIATMDWIEAVDDYVRIHVGRTSYLVRGTMQAFERELPTFLRIHRSALVNADRIREASVTPQGDYRLTLHDGTRLPTGRSYREAVAEYLRSLAIEAR